ncbi:MAG: glycogen-debranching protein, partial [Verrucomicrobia bacterium]|nr:glycogen-debranching protein [Verrucomicrobiota bacterium]
MEKTRNVNWPSIEGAPVPLGVTYIPEERAYNFALYSLNASEVTLLLFGKDDYVTPSMEFWLDPFINKTKRVWHCRIKEERLAGSYYYGYRVNGPNAGQSNALHAFDSE